MENASRVRSVRGAFWLLIALNVAFMVLSHFPVVSYVALPLATFVTALHELSHALACKATLGSVSGLTIVSDGNGHGGLTGCLGGIRLLVSPAGYLGAAFFGCILLALGRDESRARRVLQGLGVLMCVAVFFMFKGLGGNMDTYQVWASILAGGFISALFFVGGTWLPARIAWLILLIVAGQTALNALNDCLVVVLLSTGLVAGGTSDATNMAAMTHIPAIFWSVLWGAISVLMVRFTLKRCYSNG